MAGTVVRVCPPRDFIFDELGNLDDQALVVGERVDCSRYDQIDVLVRVHAEGAIPASASIEVVLFSDGFTADDPSQDFFEEIGAVTLDNSLDHAGAFVVQTINSGLGSMLAVKVRGTQLSPAAPLNARLSIDLVLKTC